MKFWRELPTITISGHQLDNQQQEEQHGLSNMVKAMTSAPAAVKQVAELSCVYCTEEHEFDNCPGNRASVNYVGNYNRQPQNNPYLNTYDPGWKQHPNYSWSNQNKNAPALSGQNRNVQPTGFHQKNQG